MVLSKNPEVVIVFVPPDGGGNMTCVFDADTCDLMDALDSLGRVSEIPKISRDFETLRRESGPATEPVSSPRVVPTTVSGVKWAHYSSMVASLSLIHI